MYVLVTGGAGFIGSNTVDYLLAQGHRVRVLDNLSTGKKANLNLKHPNLEFKCGDVRDMKVLPKALDGVTHVLHLAAQVSGSLSVENPRETFDINTCGFMCLIDAIRIINPKIRLVHASSAGVYGNPEVIPCKEEHARKCCTLSPYALSKLYDEQCGELYHRLYKMPVLALRYFNVFGPRQDPKSVYSGVISKFLCSGIEDNKIVVYGDGKQTRDFIAVHDVVRANYLALISRYSGVINIGTGKRISILCLIKTIEGILNCKFNVQFKAHRKGDVRYSVADINKAKEYLHFDPEHTLKQGLRNFIASLIC